MWKPKNFRDSIIPVSITYAILGHGVFHYPVGRQHPIFSLIYAIIVTSLYCIALGFTLDFCFSSSWYGTTEKIIFLIVYANAAIAGLAQILSWYHCKMYSRLVEKMSKVDETLQQLGANFDYTKSFNVGIALTVSWLIVIFSLNAIDVLWFLNLMPVHQIIIVVSVLHHPVHVNDIIAFNFSLAVRLIEMRLRKANELLENIATPFQQPVADKAWQCLGNEMRVPTFTISTGQILHDSMKRTDVIQIIKHVYLELSSISNDLNEVYGLQIALEVTADFVMFTGHLYNLYTIVANPSLDRRQIRIIILVIWCGSYFVKIMLINQACESVSAEAHRTGYIIHSINEPMRDPELPDEIKQFSLQIIQYPLFFSPAGLFTLGFKFVLGFFGTVTTYLVILIDMSGESTPGKQR